MMSFYHDTPYLNARTPREICVTPDCRNKVRNPGYDTHCAPCEETQARERARRRREYEAKKAPQGGTT